MINRDDNMSGHPPGGGCNPDKDKDGYKELCLWRYDRIFRAVVHKLNKCPMCDAYLMHLHTASSESEPSLFEAQGWRRFELYNILQPDYDRVKATLNKVEKDACDIQQERDDMIDEGKRVEKENSILWKDNMKHPTSG